MNEQFKQAWLQAVAPFLNQGEVARRVFVARRGEHPWVAAWSTIFGLPRVVVATDDAILVLSVDRSGLRSQVKSVVARLSRATRLGEPQFSPWALLLPPLLDYRWIRVNKERLWVRAGFDVKEVLAIDAEAGTSASTA
jgi:hypothetical protein